MDLGIKNKVALVTGGSRGLGRAICLELAAEGAAIAINYYKGDPNQQSKANELASEIQQRFGVRTLAIGGDVADENDDQMIVRTVIEQLGQLDILVNNAGIWPTAYIQDITKEEWDRTLSVNLCGPFLLSQQMIRYLLANKRPGKIINIASQAAFHGSTSGHAHYSASKAGLVNFTISLAREMASHNINVNAVAPGMMRTDMSKEALEQRLDKYLERIPLGKIAEPEDVAHVVTFLASTKADYITGATIDVTGGMLMR